MGGGQGKLSWMCAGRARAEGANNYRRTSYSYKRPARMPGEACIFTPRQREVLGLVADGLPNKAIACELGISIKTVEAHRAHVMHKTQAVSLPELVRLAHGGGL